MAARRSAGASPALSRGYYVTTLESAIRRMVSTEVSGYYAPPLSAEIIRTSGNPTGQRCELSGNTYTIW